MIVRDVRARDAPAWLRLRHALWPDQVESEHAAEITEFLEGRSGESLAVLVAANGADQLMGFAELSIRAYAEGCHTDRVAYLEGWYVVPDARNEGVGRALIAGAEAWGRSQGCVEFASDAELTNDASAAAHKALGFTEVGQVRCFRKDL
jgi:aminoglycoside 6'-N-acetyltransferase I